VGFTGESDQKTPLFRKIGFLTNFFITFFHPKMTKMRKIIDIPGFSMKFPDILPCLER
jgi:hypothetical protein